MAAVIEAACDLRVGQVGVATLKLRRLDLDAIQSELAAKLAAAPQLLTRAPVIIDLNAFSDLPDAGAARELLAAIRGSGVLPVGLTYGSPAVDALARELELPLFSRFRSAYEHDGAAAPPAAPVAPAPASARATWSRPSTARPSRWSTPTPRGGWCSPTPRLRRRLPQPVAYACMKAMCAPASRSTPAART